MRRFRKFRVGTVKSKNTLPEVDDYQQERPGSAYFTPKCDDDVFVFAEGRERVHVARFYGAAEVEMSLSKVARQRD